VLQLSLARGVATPRAGEQKGNLEKQRSFGKSKKAVLVYLHDQEPTNTYTRTSKPRTHSSVRRSHILALPSSLPEMSSARLGIMSRQLTESSCPRIACRVTPNVCPTTPAAVGSVSTSMSRSDGSSLSRSAHL
jgi:hypothetical protein